MIDARLLVFLCGLYGAALGAAITVLAHPYDIIATLSLVFIGFGTLIWLATRP